MEEATAMGIFDKAKDLVSEHENEVAQGIEKAAEVVESKVPDQFDDKVEMAANKLTEVVKGLD
jgi:hypothetical protein